MFLHFLDRNGVLFADDGSKLIDGSTLVAITIFAVRAAECGKVLRRRPAARNAAARTSCWNRETGTEPVGRRLLPGQTGVPQDRPPCFCTSLARRYWSDLKRQLKAEGSEVYEKIVRLKMTAADGKKQKSLLAVWRSKSTAPLSWISL